MKLGLTMIFLDITSKVQAMNANLNKWDDINLKSFCIANEKISKLKGLISTVYKKLLQLNSKENNKTI